MRVIGARVGHGLTQPQRIEVVTEIVVPVDVVARSGKRVATRAVKPRNDAVGDGISGVWRAQSAEQRHHEPDQIALDLQLARAVGIAETNLRVAQQTPQRAAVRDSHGFRRPRRTRGDALTGPSEFELDGRVAEACEEPAQKTGFE